MDRKGMNVVFGLVALAVITRLLPHPPNFAPITSIALFTGFHFVNAIGIIYTHCMYVSHRLIFRCSLFDAHNIQRICIDFTYWIKG